MVLQERLNFIFTSSTSLSSDSLIIVVFISPSVTEYIIDHIIIAVHTYWQY